MFNNVIFFNLKMGKNNKTSKPKLKTKVKSKGKVKTKNKSTLHKYCWIFSYVDGTQNNDFDFSGERVEMIFRIMYVEVVEFVLKWNCLRRKYFKN